MQANLQKNIGIAMVFSLFLCSFTLFENKKEEAWKTRLEYARVLSYMKKYDQSEHEYRELLKEKPDDTRVKVELVKVYYYQKKNKEAAALIKQIPLNQLSPEEELILAEIAVSEKNYPQAEEAYRKIAAGSSEKKEEAQLKLAEVLSWDKKYEESLAIYQDLLKKHPHDLYLRRQYAMVLSWAGKNEEAAKELEATLSQEGK